MVVSNIVESSHVGGHTNVNTVIVPVAAGHVLVDICVDARHDGRRDEGVARGGAGGKREIFRLVLIVVRCGRRCYRCWRVRLGEVE